MEGTPPPTLSALAHRLVRRPPSISDVVALLRYSEDYGWFVDLTRRMFPEEADRIMRIPGVRGRVAEFATLVERRHFQLQYGLIEYILEEDGIPPCTWLRRGIPFMLYGFSYDDFHEMWSSYSTGLSAIALLTRPYGDHLGNEAGLRVSWLESAAVHIPQEVLDRIPAGGIKVDRFRRALAGTQFEGAAMAAAWIWSETGLYFLDCNSDDFDGFVDPWDEDVIELGTKEWARAAKILDAADKAAKWLDMDLPVRFAELLDYTLPRLPDEEEEDNDE